MIVDLCSLLFVSVTLFSSICHFVNVCVYVAILLSPSGEQFHDDSSGLGDDTQNEVLMCPCSFWLLSLQSNKRIIYLVFLVVLLNLVETTVSEISASLLCAQFFPMLLVFLSFHLSELLSWWHVFLGCYAINCLVVEVNFILPLSFVPLSLYCSWLYSSVKQSTISWIFLLSMVSWSLTSHFICSSSLWFRCFPCFL